MSEELLINQEINSETNDINNVEIDSSNINIASDENLISNEEFVVPIENRDNDIPEPNCLALTVKKDYNLTIVKNIFTKTGRMSIKVALSTLVLNFLRMFF